MVTGMLGLMNQLAWRSLWSHRAKSLVVGTVIAMGVFILVLADAMLDSIYDGMESSITSSITGQLQLYDKEAEDKLSLMGTLGNFLTEPHFGQIDDFETVRKTVEAHPNVAAVIPMGTDSAMIFSGNSMDQALQELRDAIDQANLELSPEQTLLVLKSPISRVKAIVEHLSDEYQLIAKITGQSDSTVTALKHINTVSTEQFWQEFALNPTQQLQFLDTRIAPLVDNSLPIFLEILGTDLERFQKHFGRFKIVKGASVPQGKRGLLINDFQYEKIMKDRMARVFDSITELKQNENTLIAENQALQDYIGRRSKEYKKWILSFDGHTAEKIAVELRQFLGLPKASLELLIPRFMDLTDDNFERRKAFFYERIRPEINLYPIDIGDDLTLNKFGNGESQRVRLYGTYKFDGVENTGFSGLFHLVDMITFRELHGYLTEQQKIEIADLKQEFSTPEWNRQDVESALFENTDSSSHLSRFESLDDQSFDPDFKLHSDGSQSIVEQINQTQQRTYSQQEIDRGATLSAAVILRDLDLLEQTQTEIAQLLDQADLPVQVIDWQTASGQVGQMITVMKIVLFIFIIFVFSVSMVVVNNAMLMAIINRYGEIGTLRAIGASRNVIMGIFLIESLILTLIASIIGALAGLLFVTYLSHVGIPAPRLEIQFLFGGQRLYPTMSPDNLYLGPLVILLVGVTATFYPALLATRVPPVVAMNARE
ncbi:MAG: hypothetical protein COB04_10485 [Gammaproteobacteria bacterium]|nr:MAG: hypothetical protein COB04_10485 [Gammaproteobacteria bacterium]